MKITVGVSNRHVHLTKEVYNQLFFDEIEKLRSIDQPTQYAAVQTVTIKKGDQQIEKVRVVGPLRDYNQVEISRTDAYKLKVDPPIKTSGDLDNSLGITLIGPKGEVELDKGLILANRHIHITPDLVKRYKLQDTDELAVLINGEKSGILKNVYLKVQDEAALKLHLDTDDANAFNLKNGDEVEVLRVQK